MKPDVLVVTRNLPPLVGGMERLVWHLVDELRSTYRVHVAGPIGSRQHLPSDVHVIEIPLQPMLFFLLRIKLSALWLALRYRPRVILAGSGLTAPFVWLAARMTGACCIVYLHGLDIYVRHPLYRLLWRPFFSHFDCVLVNSNCTKQLALDVHISEDRITILYPGVELPGMGDAQQRRASFRTRYNFGESPLLLSVGRITSRKGLSCFSDKIFPLIIQEIPEVKLVIVGDDPSDALLSAGAEHTKVKKILKGKNIESKVCWLGCCSEQELHDAYFAADVLIFPIQQLKNDIEGFGMVAIEAAAHGVPTVAFSVGGVTDAVADGSCGHLISADDNPAFARAVVQLLESRHLSRQVTACRAFARVFEWDSFGRQLRSLLHDVETSYRGNENG